MTMDFEEAYKEMVQRARELHESGNELTKKQMEIVCPQLAESEDERIRQEIHAYLFNTLHNTQQLTPRTNELERWIAYLEKQKEQKPGDEDRYMNGKNDALKEQMGESKEWANELSAEIDRISKRYPEVSFAKLSRIAVHFARWQKDQKPAEIDEYKIIKKHITEDSLSSEVNKRLKECGWYVTYDKPAEWSEEDREMLERCIESIKLYRDYYAAKAPDSRRVDDKYNPHNEEIDWLNSLHERFNPQPKQEWDEEEEEKRNRIILLVEYSIKEIGGSVKYEEALDWFKSLRPQPHWKPSEEQMKHLSSVMVGWHPDISDCQSLHSLYDDLKKL